MNTETDRKGIRFGRIAASVAVSDLPRALEFYTKIMGMEVKFTNGQPMGFAIVRRDDGELHLSLQAGYKGSTTNACHLLVNDATAFYAHCVASGVRIIKGLRDHSYGQRAFVIADLDGNRIDVGQVMTKG
jgi:catechol 2,3-dioxygenase-like lactoylglutathione lyase family enzyme